ncbi:hypothetical protein H0H92_007094 [Tricholoma furcatifolium]|nr:hypothetical protein H0H92_007094 [Tricholoma furcatifolium]
MIRDPFAPEATKLEALIERLTAVFKDKKDYRKLLSCRGSSAQSLLDIFQRLLDVANIRSPSFQRNLIAAAQRLAEKSGLCPRCYELDDVTTSDTLEGSGGFADIYKGLFRGRAVCLKTIRLNTRSIERGHTLESTPASQRPTVLWCLPLQKHGIFRGPVDDKWGRPELLEVASRLKSSCDYIIDVIAIYLLFEASDVAQGLKFLHNNGIVHGDLKGANILINEFERACIADFGLSSVSDKEILTWTSHSAMSSKGGTVRWQAPELFNPEEEEDILNTPASDIYAWACVAYEIFAGCLPFAHLTRDAAVMNKVMMGQRPVRPLDSSPSWDVWGLTEDIWALMEACWDSVPVRRPSVDAVIERLERTLPEDVSKEVNVDFLSPAQFREMARPELDKNELSVETLESLLSHQ